MLRNDCHLGVIHRGHRCNVLRSLHQSTDMALQSISDRIKVSYISREHEKLVAVSEIIMPSRHKNFLSTMLGCETRFIDLVNCIMNHAVALEPQYDGQLRQDRTSDIAHDTQSSQFI